MEAKYRKIAAVLLILVCLAQVPAAAAEPGGAAEAVRLVPVGEAIGIQVEASGLLVVGLTEVQTAQGPASPAWEAGLRTGDLITAVGPVSVSTAAQLRDALSLAEGAVGVRFLRDGRQQQLSVSPALNQAGEPELGVWLRSGLSGIGTMTYYDPETGFYGALGHAVSDAETGVVLPLKTGFIGNARLESIVRGQQGKPGELKGGMGLEAPIGGVLRNTPQGVFGCVEKDGLGALGGEAVEICPLREVRCGPAALLSDVDGTVRTYEAEITRIYHGQDGSRDLLLTVTDPALLELTGGIVQGMSGSPILQDGRLVGAVTHVLVSDPTKGYCIGIERMLAAAAPAA